MPIRPMRALLLSALLLFILTIAPAAGARAVPRGLADVNLFDESPTERVQIMDEYAQLRVSHLRMGLDWPRAETARGVYNETYLAAIDDIAALAHERGIKLVLTILYTPKWASDTSLWDEKPPGYTQNGWKPCYPPALGHLDDLQEFARSVAARYAGKVFAYECWNEPNLWVFLFPQERRPGDDFAVRRYAKMLKAFHAGIKAGDPGALVIAGATAPIGQNSRYTRTTLYNRTTPQHFARTLKGALEALDGRASGAYFDAYSHHPYTPGGSREVAPEALPTDPATTVQLRNLGTLLRVFPNKPFYLTELGYNTSSSAIFGGLPLSQATQADYLRRAYRYAGRYSRVKALFWYLRRDQSPSGRSSDPYGVYTGLRAVNGARKRSWFTFAGGNRLTLEAPRTVRRGRAATLRGALTCSRLGTPTTGVAGKDLTLQRRVAGHWRKLKAVSTKSGSSAGAYSCSVRPSSSGRYRLVWSGVVTSPDRWITVE